MHSFSSLLNLTQIQYLIYLIRALNLFIVRWSVSLDGYANTFDIIIFKSWPMLLKMDLIIAIAFGISYVNSCKCTSLYSSMLCKTSWKTITKADTVVLILIHVVITQPSKYLVSLFPFSYQQNGYPTATNPSTASYSKPPTDGSWFHNKPGRTWRKSRPAHDWLGPKMSNAYFH